MAQRSEAEASGAPSGGGPRDDRFWKAAGGAGGKISYRTLLGAVVSVRLLPLALLLLINGCAPPVATWEVKKGLQFGPKMAFLDTLI
jgi:hypothetical protein